MSTSQHLLNQTNGGLDIFRRYINHNFSVGESFQKGQERFTIIWSDRYENYILRHELSDGKRYRWYQNYNAIFFLQEKFGLTKAEVFEMLVREMSLTMPDSVAPTFESNETNLMISNSAVPTILSTENLELRGF